MTLVLETITCGVSIDESILREQACIALLI